MRVTDLIRRRPEADAVAVVDNYHEGEWNRTSKKEFERASNSLEGDAGATARQTGVGCSLLDGFNREFIDSLVVHAVDWS